MFMSTAAGQRKLSAFFSKLDRSIDWNLRLFGTPEEIEGNEFLAGLNGEFDAVVYSAFAKEKNIKALCRFPGPLVAMEMPSDSLLSRTSPTAIIHNDPASIAEAAAKYFTNQGSFRSAAFIHERQSYFWSLVRGKAFAAAMTEHSPLEFSPNGLSEKADRPRLGRFLSRLEKPAFVLCANDRRAAETMNAALAAGIDVPGELSILGVDNDPYACTNRIPALSSIEPDHLREGEIAAELIQKMLLTPSADMSSEQTPESLLVKVRQTVFRESTLFPPSGRYLLERASDYLKSHSGENLTPAHIAAAMGVSRSLIDLRLREAKRPTLAAQIADARLTHLAKALKETDAPIDVLLDTLGFENHNSIRNRFKARFGLSLRDYRAK